MITTENNNSPQVHDELGCWPTKSLLKHCEKAIYNEIGGQTYWRTKDMQGGSDVLMVRVNSATIVVKTVTVRSGTDGKKKTIKKEFFTGSEAYKIDMTELEKVEYTDVRPIMMEV